LGNLSTPKSVQKLQMALHAKAKAEAGYRFYALYDKISRDDILAHAYAQCRSNKGAPGVDGQDFADIEAHGVQRWLGELALALRQKTYRPDPIRRVFIPKANGKLRPLEELLFRGHPDVVDADLADYFGSIPHAELLKSVARRGTARRKRRQQICSTYSHPRHTSTPPKIRLFERLAGTSGFPESGHCQPAVQAAGSRH